MISWTIKRILKYLDYSKKEEKEQAKRGWVFWKILLEESEIKPTQGFIKKKKEKKNIFLTRETYREIYFFFLNWICPSVVFSPSDES